MDDERIHRAILQDEDFIGMMVNIYLLKHYQESERLSIEKREEHLAIFDKHFKLLDGRYPDFHNNVLQALNNRSSEYYISYSERLYKQVRKSLSSEAARTKYDASSVCGVPCVRPEGGLGCLTGCGYSNLHCMRYGGTSCDQMLEYCKSSCCSSFCEELPRLGN